MAESESRSTLGMELSSPRYQDCGDRERDKEITPVPFAVKIRFFHPVILNAASLMTSSAVIEVRGLAVGLFKRR